MAIKNNIWRIPLLGLAGLALVTGLWAGLVRMGWSWPVLHPALPLGHGPLMVSGFLGTLILLERAVAISKPWAYAGVAFSGLGGVLVAAGAPGLAGPALLSLGSLWLVFIFLYILRQHKHLYTAAMVFGAGCWLAGSLFWLFGAPVYQVVLWWAAFLVLTIAGERLELSRVTRLTAAAMRLFLLACLVLVSGLLMLQGWLDLGWRVFGLGLAALATWLFYFDIARRTVRMAGLPRYIAVCLLAGYAWLAFAGLAGISFGAQLAGLRYDLVLHAIFLGFVFSMVFGHALIILPAVLKIDLPYSPVFYLPVTLLHASLLLRAAGDLAGIHTLRLWGGLTNALVILLFLGLAARAGFSTRQQKASQGLPGSN